MSRRGRWSWALSALLSLLPLAARADCGSVPFWAPVTEGVSVDDRGGMREVSYDPLKVTVFEPKQRAIILWNGQEEVLLLSTDQHASQRSAVLEVIPLPGEPTVRLGSFKSFEVAQKLMIDKNIWACAHPGASAELTAKLLKPAGRISFEGKLGAHDLAVAEVLDKDHFNLFVQSYLGEHYQTAQAPIRPEFLSIIQSYLDEGFRWFAFDVITLDGQNRSREPIEYRFKSDCVFYPLRISTLEQGRTEVDLLVFTSTGGDRFEGIDASAVKVAPRSSVTLTELGGLAPGWDGFFGAASQLQMHHWQIEGESPRLTRDVRVR